MEVASIFRKSSENKYIQRSTVIVIAVRVSFGYNDRKKIKR